MQIMLTAPSTMTKLH